MATVTSTLKLTDKMSKPTKNIINNLRKVDEKINKIPKTIKMADGSSSNIKRINKNLNSTKKKIGAIPKNIRIKDKASKPIKNINKNLEDTKKKMGGVSAKAIALGTIMGNVMVSITRKVMDLAASIPKIGDELTLVNNRMNLIVAEGENVAEVNEKIFRSAQKTHASYIDTADAIAKMGVLAGEAFAGTDEVIAFMEQINKQITISGTGIVGTQAAMLQLTQAMGSGTLRGDELRTILEQVPTIVQSIGKYLDTDVAGVRELAAEGQITADVVKNAMFANAEATNEQFEAMGITSSQAFTIMKNASVKAFSSMTMGISSFVSDGILWMLNNLDLVIVGLGAISIILSVKLIPKLYAMLTPIFLQAGAWAVANAPLLITVGIVSGLLVLFLKFPKAFGVITGGVKAVFTAIGNMLSGIVNAIVDVINIAVKALNKLPGIDLRPVSKIAYDSVAEAYGEGKEFGISLSEKASAKIDEFTKKITGLDEEKIDYTAFGKDGKLKGGKLDSIGKINSDVTISDENMKWIKDIAMQRYKITYQQTTPQLTAYFGDVRETADIDAVMGELENKFLASFDSNLEG